jgi:hypothetical protein
MLRRAVRSLGMGVTRVIPGPMVDIPDDPHQLADVVTLCVLVGSTFGEPDFFWRNWFPSRGYPSRLGLFGEGFTPGIHQRWFLPKRISFVLVLPGCQLMDDSPKNLWVCFFGDRWFCMHLQREGIRQPSMDWWTPGIFTWEEGTPPVHLRTPLVVRSHEVLTGGPAIPMAGQSTVCQRLV